MIYGTVERTERLTPHMTRVVLGGEGLVDFEGSPFTDAYVNLAFAPPGAPYELPGDLEQIAATATAEMRPIRRRYTVRRWEQATRTLTIDFVTHDDEGTAGAWAARAQPDDALQLTNPGGSYRPDPSAAWHLMVGDESALPAIAASLEVIGRGVPVLAVLVADGPADELPLDTPGALDVRWVHRGGDPDVLQHTVRDLAMLPGAVHAFVHGEAGEVRTARRHLLADRGVPRGALHASGYWRRTMTDEAWRRVKADWEAQVQQDVPA